MADNQTDLNAWIDRIFFTEFARASTPNQTKPGRQLGHHCQTRVCPLGRIPTLEADPVSSRGFESPSLRGAHHLRQLRTLTDIDEIGIGKKILRCSRQLGRLGCWGTEANDQSKYQTDKD